MADYTPSADFDFTGLTGYTPSPDFDFTVEAGNPSLIIGQLWALDAPGIESGHWGQLWSLSAYQVAEVMTRQAWALHAPTFRNVTAAAKWTLSAPAFRNVLPGQLWALAVPTFADRPAAQAWTLTVPTFADSQPRLTWSLIAPTIEVGHWGQSWHLEATAVWTKVISATAYIFALEQDGNRVEIPISNFSAQMRSGEPSFLQATIPDAAAWAETLAAYSAHADSEIVIDAGYRWSDGSYTTAELIRITLRNIQQYYGARTNSATVDGTDTRTNASPQNRTLAGASYYSIEATGRTRYRCRPDFDCRPGDTVTVNGETFVVGEVSWQVSATDATMEVAEAID